MTRVCPHCGEPPGAGVFCEACGRNLGDVEQLPTREEWQTAQVPADSRSPAEATAAFLEAMLAAGRPGTSEFPLAVSVGPFKRTPKARGWVVRPVDREDFDGPKRYEPGLVLTVEGAFHVLDNELRGWGQRNFPQYPQTVRPEPIESPADKRLRGELAAVLEANGVRAR
jgi:hypothetical protein